MSADPVPAAGLRLIQLASTRVVQEQLDVVSTCAVVVPPAAGTDADPGVTTNVHVGTGLGAVGELPSPHESVATAIANRDAMRTADRDCMRTSLLPDAIHLPEGIEATYGGVTVAEELSTDKPERRTQEIPYKIFVISLRGLCALGGLREVAFARDSGNLSSFVESDRVELKSCD